MSSSVAASRSVSLEMIQSANWVGAIPIKLTLATTSLSSPSVPSPIYTMVPRQSYLHIALRSAIQNLNQFAPSEFSFTFGMIQEEPSIPSSTVDGHEHEQAKTTDDNQAEDTNVQTRDRSGSTYQFSCKDINARDEINASSFPVCWLEDEETQTALRWQLFAGVLYDLCKGKCTILDAPLPWKIRLHFNKYPVNQIIPLQSGSVLTQIRQYYQNSVKQSLTLQTGNSKAALNLNKESHGLLWDSVQNNNYRLFRQLDFCDFTKKRHDNILRIPIRIYVDAKPPIQPSCRDPTLTLGGLFTSCLPEYFEATKNIQSNNNRSREREFSSGIEDNESVTVTYRARDETVCWKISGITPTLDTNIFDLWKNICHPDQFLYIIILTR